MADFFATVPGALGSANGPKRYVDMGDGSFAERVVASAIGDNGNAASAANPAPVEAYAPGGGYETIAASATAQALGATGAIGDYLDHVLILVAIAATGTVTVKDGATTVAVFPNSPGGGIGAYDLPIHARSVVGAWNITTGAGASAVGFGKFT